MQWRVSLQPGETSYSVDREGYEALATNTAATAAWVREASWQLDFYRRNRACTPGGSK